MGRTRRLCLGLELLLINLHTTSQRLIPDVDAAFGRDFSDRRGIAKSSEQALWDAMQGLYVYLQTTARCDIEACADLCASSLFQLM